MSINSITGVNTANITPELWASFITENFKAKLVAANFFADFSEDFVDGGDSINLPFAVSFSANDKTNGNEVTLQQLTNQKITLTVDTWKEASLLIEKKELAQVLKSYNIMSRYMRDEAYALAATYDSAILSNLLSLSNKVGTSTSTIVDSDIRLAIAKIESANVPLDECAFLIDPAVFWNQIYGLDRFTSRDFVTNAPVSNGFEGRLYGIPVYTTTQIPYVSGTTGKANALVHRDAIAHAAVNRTLKQLTSKSSDEYVEIESKVDTEVNYIPMYKGWLVSSDIIFGSTVYRDDAAVLILTAK